MAKYKVEDKSIEDTGERMIPAYHRGHMVYGEHIVRYRAAQALVSGKTVLDIASGSGYGSGLMGETAKTVIGVDIDADAIAYATKNYATENVSFTLGDGVKIPLGDESVDVVVSFETIEHIENYRAFLEEVRRVLKADGLFLLSTPNDTEFPESNHYHVHEFEHAELETEVKRYFKNIKNYYQATWLYNVLGDRDVLGKEWEQPIATMQTAPVKPDRAIYFFMLCSNRNVVEEVPPLAAISEHWSERRMQENENGIRKHIEDQGDIIRHLKDQSTDAEKELAAAKQKLAEVEQKLAAIHSSKAWKVMKKAKQAIKKIST